jgi:hypothetical protein
MRALLIIAVAAGVGACDRASSPSAIDPPNYKLVCDSSDTRQSSTLFWVRIDTRDGDIRSVDLGRLPQSNGPTRSAAGDPGRYDLVCDSTNTDTRSDFRCLRLDRQTGEMMLVNLPKLGVIPPRS